jgi:hypothetical protein
MNIIYVYTKMFSNCIVLCRHTDVKPWKSDQYMLSIQHISLSRLVYCGTYALSQFPSVEFPNSSLVTTVACTGCCSLCNPDWAQKIRDVESKQHFRTLDFIHYTVPRTEALSVQWDVAFYMLHGCTLDKLIVEISRRATDIASALTQTDTTRSSRPLVLTNQSVPWFQRKTSNANSCYVYERPCILQTNS